MNEELNKLLSADTDGLLTYEYMANHIDGIDEVLDTLIDRMIAVDMNGQFLVSAARYLSAIDAVDEPNASDNNFRRIYKRLYPTSI